MGKEPPPLTPLKRTGEHGFTVCRDLYQVFTFFLLIFLGNPRVAALGQSESRADLTPSFEPPSRTNLSTLEAAPPAPLWKTRWGLEFVPTEFRLWEDLARLDRVEAVSRLYHLLRQEGLPKPERTAALLELAELHYASGLAETALELFFQASVDHRHPLISLRLAELGLYHAGWPRSRVLRNVLEVQPEKLERREAELWRLLLRRSLWERHDLRALGLTEASLSALGRDHDDIWGGTWNGGIFRFSWSSKQTRIFRNGRFQTLPNAVVAIVPDRFAIWFAAQDGLHRFNKVTEEWSTLPLPAEVQPERIQSFARIRSELYLCTLGHGLWTLGQNRWTRLALDEVSKHFNGVFDSPDGVLLATRDRGLYLWDPDSGRISPLAGPSVAPRNVTAVLVQGRYLWVGTYGEGLYRYDRLSRTWERFTRSTGHLPDDWVMCLAQIGDTVFAGTFGGGLLAVRGGRFHFLSDFGSPADVVTMLDYRGELFVGTLREGLWAVRGEDLDALLAP